MGDERSAMASELQQQVEFNGIEAERGENHIKEAYEEVLQETADSPMNELLLAQYAKVKAGHDTIRDLRDSLLQRNTRS